MDSSVTSLRIISNADVNSEKATPTKFTSQVQLNHRNVLKKQSQNPIQTKSVNMIKVKAERGKALS